MEPGPLPPHERTWRHPSELGPTRADVDAGPHHHLAALTVGALAVMAVIGMVVAMTPRSSSSSPVALSATTAPATSSTSITSAPRAAVASSAGFAGSRAPIGALLTSFASMPHAITSAAPLTLDGAAIAERLPRSGDLVLVHTDEVTYKLPWDQVDELRAPDGSVVFDSDGALLARVLDGEVVTIVGD